MVSLVEGFEVEGAGALLEPVKTIGRFSVDARLVIGYRKAITIIREPSQGSIA